MINFKQRELSQNLFEQLQEKFPEIRLVQITESIENPSAVWIKILVPEDGDREIELQELAGELSTEILLNYGYLITIQATGRLEKTKN